MLKLGYFLPVVAGILFGGYVAYWIVRIVVLILGIGVFFKVVILIGLVWEDMIRARNLGRDIMAGLRNIIGWEIKDYTVMLSQARDQALSRMVAEAERLGANAVVGVRFTTSQTMSGAAEILAYGTAVRIK